MIIKALVPARSGSERVKNKNGRKLNGVPLLVYPFLTCVDIPEIQECWLSTNSTEYKDMAREYGWERVIMRPEKYCKDDSGDLEVISHALKALNPVDLIVYLRPTTPLRSSGMVKLAIAAFLEANEHVTGLRSVHEMSESAWKCCTVHLGLIKPFAISHFDKPNQDCPTTYHPNGYVDICIASRIRNGDLWGDTIMAWETSRVVEIDTEEDWRYAEFLATKGMVH